ncbi:MAG TPA: energy transducer TonB [Candidatus Udaeobacter sp.]|nr:energy transducer TonB [Candidatus Udaeobacter sp.]
MNERSSRATAEGASIPAPRIRSWFSPRAVLPIVITVLSICGTHAQSTSPAARPAAPKAIYTPKPVYRAEWAKQRLTGKGVVLVTIDKQTGNVTGARMLTSTGNQQLDGAALQAYSQWRFDPRTVVVPQLQIPIEFATRPTPQPAKRTVPQSWILVIVLVVGGAAVAALRRRRA